MGRAGEGGSANGRCGLSALFVFRVARRGNARGPGRAFDTGRTRSRRAGNVERVKRAPVMGPPSFMMSLDAMTTRRSDLASPGVGFRRRMAPFMRASAVSRFSASLTPDAIYARDRGRAQDERRPPRARRALSASADDGSGNSSITSVGGPAGAREAGAGGGRTVHRSLELNLIITKINVTFSVVAFLRERVGRHRAPLD